MTTLAELESRALGALDAALRTEWNLLGGETDRDLYALAKRKGRIQGLSVARDIIAQILKDPDDMRSEPGRR